MAVGVASWVVGAVHEALRERPVLAETFKQFKMIHFICEAFWSTDFILYCPEHYGCHFFTKICM